MAVRLIQEGVCAPLTVEEVKHFLAVDSDSVAENVLLENLIEATASEASVATGRIWVESKWLWELEGEIPSTPIQFPVCPVTKVEIFDNDEVVAEGAEPTDLSSELVKVTLPSLEPLGTPLVGSLLAVQAFPLNYSIVLTCGYPVLETTTPIPQKDAIVVDQYKTTYTPTKIHLVFNRPVNGNAKPSDFKVEIEGVSYVPQTVNFEKDGITLEFLENELLENTEIVLTYIGGYIEDAFGNFLLPISGFTMPNVEFKTEEDFQEPTPVPVETTYKSLTPKQIKQWMLIRIGTLYSQRTEIASKGTGAMYSTQFIDGLLKQYKVAFA